MAKFNVVQGDVSNASGGPPGDALLEHRVARLESLVEEIRASLRSIEESLAKLREDVAFLKGSMSRVPGPLMNWSMIISTWIAGAGIVLLAFRFMDQ